MPDLSKLGGGDNSPKAPSQLRAKMGDGVSKLGKLGGEFLETVSQTAASAVKEIAASAAQDIDDSVKTVKMIGEALAISKSVAASEGPQDIPLTDELPEEVAQEIYNATTPTQEYIDPLEATHFNPIDYINQRFPSEESLDQLDPFVASTSAKLAAIDEEISKAVEVQSQAGQQAASDIEDAKHAINDLFEKISDIKEKARHSEVMVQDICKDIKQLDFAKQHLQETITALKRLHMLVAAVEQLREKADQQQYREAANLVDAVKQLLTHFDNYSTVPKIAEIKETYGSIRKVLAEQIFEAFKEIEHLASNVADAENFSIPEDVPGQIRSLSEACMVVDALGLEARQRQVHQCCLGQLKQYAGIFREKGDGRSLDDIDRRFHWYKRLLKSVDARFTDVFPPYWRMPHRLTLEFLAQTRTAVQEVLECTPPKDLDVKKMIHALQKTLTFEREMQARFEPRETRRGSVPGEQECDQEGNIIDQSMSANAIKNKYSRENKEKHRLEDERKAREGGKSMFSSFAKEGTSAEVEEKLPPIEGSLSGVFDPFMGPYIAFETKQLEEELEKVMKGEEVDDSGKLQVFSSSLSIFSSIKGSVKRCVALTTGQTLLGLTMEFNRCLRGYAKLLASKLPSNTKQHQGKESYKIPDGQEQKICHIVNTAEYCSETLPGLAEMIKQRIDPAYKDKVSMDKAQEEFLEVVAQAVKVLVSGLETRLEPAFTSMRNQKWETMEIVGEESDYVTMANEAITSYIPILKASLSGLWFRGFCDKFAAAFIASYLSRILALKRINPQAGSQQLQLDLYSLKNLMLSLPNTGVTGEFVTPIPPSYTKFVIKQLGKVETLLKLVGTPTELIVERFRTMLPDGTAEELQGIMNLRGMKKNEQQNIFETLGFGSIGEVENVAKANPAAAMFNVSIPYPVKSDILEQGRAQMAKTATMASKFEAGMKKGTGFFNKKPF